MDAPLLLTVLSSIAAAHRIRCRRPCRLAEWLPPFRACGVRSLSSGGANCSMQVFRKLPRSIAHSTAALSQGAQYQGQCCWLQHLCSVVHLLMCEATAAGRMGERPRCGGCGGGGGGLRKRMLWTIQIGCC